MPSPKAGYRLKSGERVPGTTTITSRFKESGGLIHWANRLALEPLLKARHMASEGSLPELVEFLTTADPDAWDNKKAAQKAADAGSCAHEQVECFIHGKEFDATKYPANIVELARPAFDAFREWAANSKFQVTEAEQSLVSEQYKFGGTRDGVFVSGKRAIYDLKTSKDIYPEYLIQLAAYGILDEEAGNVIDGGYHLLQISKQEEPTDPVRFSHRFWDHLEPAKRAFIILREAYDLMSILARLAK